MKTTFLLALVLIRMVVNYGITLSSSASNHHESQEYPTVTEESAMFLHKTDENNASTTGPTISYRNALVEISHGGAHRNNSTTEASVLLNSFANAKGSSTGFISTGNKTNVANTSKKKDMKTHKIATRDIATNAESDILPAQQGLDKPATESITQNLLSLRLSSEIFSVMNYAKGQSNLVRIITGKSESSSDLSSQVALTVPMRESLDAPQDGKTPVTSWNILTSSENTSENQTKSTDTRSPTKTPLRSFQTTPKDVTTEPAKVSALSPTSKYLSVNQNNGAVHDATLATKISDGISVDDSAQTWIAASVSSSKMETIFPSQNSTGLISTGNKRNVANTSKKKDMKTHKIATRDIATNAESDISPPQQGLDKPATESITQNLISSKLPSETFSVMNYAKGQSTLERITTGKSESSSHLSSQVALTELMKKSLEVSQDSQTPVTSSWNILTSKEGSKLEKQELNTSENQTKSTDTRSPTETPLRSFQTTAKDVTTEPAKVSALEPTQVQTSKHSSVNQKNDDTTLGTKISDGISIDNGAQTRIAASVSSSKMDTTLPSQNSTNPTKPSTSLISSVNTEIATISANKDRTSANQDTTDTTTGKKIFTTKYATSPTTKPNPGTMKQSTKAATSEPQSAGKLNEREDWNLPGKRNPTKNNNSGQIVAGVITGALLLMFISIVIIWAMHRRRKKKQIKNNDWAGPSPFLEGNIEPNMPARELFHENKSKRISLHSFLPHQLSSRLSMLPEDELQMANISEGHTFGRNGQNTVLPQDDKIEVKKDQTQMYQSNQSLPDESTHSDFPVTEKVNSPTAPASSFSTQSRPDDVDEETIPFTATEKNNTDPPPPHFEDIDLDPTPRQTSEHATLPTPPQPQSPSQ